MAVQPAAEVVWLFGQARDAVEGEQLFFLFWFLFTFVSFFLLALTREDEQKNSAFFNPVFFSSPKINKSQASYYLQQPRFVHRPTMCLTSAFVAEQLSAAFDVYDPDLVVSVHPLMQLVPLRVLRRRAAARAKAQAAAVARSGDASALGRARAASLSASSSSSHLHHHHSSSAVSRFDDHHVRDPGQPPPFATVVTDLTTCHNTWFDPRVDACFVPTEECAGRARKLGVPPEKIIVHGLPIRPGFAKQQPSKRFLRRKLGMDPEMPAVLLVGALALIAFVVVLLFSFFFSCFSSRSFFTFFLSTKTSFSPLPLFLSLSPNSKTSFSLRK